MTQKDYQQLALRLIGEQFSNIELLIVAFTHRSYLNEHKKSVKEHNERMEFLGDAVLELVVTEHLYLNYIEPEGLLTNWRSALVRTESLSEAAIKLNLEDYLRLSRGEKNGSERARRQIMANVLESVIGAIYLDRGYESAKKFVEANVLIKLEAILEHDKWRDAKSHLQEVVQSVDGVTPSYKVLEEEGPDHDKIFTIGVFVGENVKGKGYGSSKQIAQQQAAQEALKAYI